MTLVVHPHFHPRRTGVTAHTELVAAALSSTIETRVMGDVLPKELPRITWGALWKRSGRETVVWHAHRNNELLAGLLLRLLGRRLKLVFTRHSGTKPGWLTRWLMGRVDALVTLNAEVARLVGRPSTIVQHGVPLERFLPPGDRDEAFRVLGLPGKRALGVVGRIRPSKGQGDFVEAIAPLLKKFPDVTPVLVGLAKEADVAWSESLQARTGGRLQRPGESRDVARWYRGLSIVVHPSHAEAFSMVLVEAMAAGCCVVASRLPAVPDVIEHGRTGFLFEPGDVAGLRAILSELLADPARVKAIGDAAAAEAKQRFGVEREAAALVAIYDGVLGARSRLS